MILAGGKGERLFPLTAMRSKPSVPFGGRYRIVDFVLSNMVNSHIFSNYLLVQYKSQSLIEHIRKNWVLSPIVKDHFMAVVPPQMRMGPEWFQGTADAVYQNANIIMEHNPALVIIFGADHIYRMDIRQMIDFHLSSGADVTVAARPVSVKEASAFGVIDADKEGRIKAFVEKPKNPPHMHGDPTRSYVSMGNYIFSYGALMKSLSEAQSRRQHDFGAHILPAMVEQGKRVFSYDFAMNTIPGMAEYEEPAYWRDVGTIQAFFDAHMDMLGPTPKFNLANKHWPILSGTHEGASSMIIKGDIENSLVSEGSIIKGGKIRNSVLRRGVVVEDGAIVENCIVMDNVTIRKGAHISRVIIDKNNVIEEGKRIGVDPNIDRFTCHVDRSGIAIMPKGGKVNGRGE